MHVAGMRANDNNSDLHLKVETATNYARQLLGAGNDFENIWERENMTFEIQKLF